MMNPSFYIKLYLLTIPVFFLIDIIWLGTMVPKLYYPNIGHLMSKTPNWTAAAIFYSIYIVGILFFAVVPALQNGNLQKAIFLGAMFGFFTYATYDLTNLATLKDWSVKVVIADILWGTFLCGSVAAGSFSIGKWLLS